MLDLLFWPFSHIDKLELENAKLKMQVDILQRENARLEGQLRHVGLMLDDIMSDAAAKSREERGRFILFPKPKLVRA